MYMNTLSYCRNLIAMAAIAVAALSGPAHAQKDTALWEAVRSGNAFAMIRHALAPGTGDPQRVVIGDCTTQRNLSDAGRDQARAIGAAFRSNGIAAARVFTSQWCRCAETARLLGIGPVEPLPALNSFFGNRESEPAQTAALTARIKQDKPVRTAGNPLVLVTHQVNITALTGVYPRSGEIIVARFSDKGDIDVLGRLFPADAN
jgi:phosphohistidine phosphatase SixA